VINCKVLCLVFILTLTLSLTPLKASVNCLELELDLRVSRLYQPVIHNYTILTPTDSGILTLDLRSDEVYMLLSMSTHRLGLVSDNLLVGISKTLNNTYITLINNNSLVSVRLDPTSVLYDLLGLNNEVLLTGYVLVNNSYKLLLTKFNVSEVSLNSYIANCTACYGRKVLRYGDSIFVVGSTYSRDPNYLWSYNVFVGRLDNNYLIGKYVGLEGDDEVVDTYLINDYIYIIFNSRISGLYIAVVSLEGLNVSTYKVLVNDNLVWCTSASVHGDDLFMVVNDLNTNYLLILTTPTLTTKVFNLGSYSTLSVVGDYIILLGYNVSTLRNYFIICNITDFLKGVTGSSYASLKPTKAYPTDLKLGITEYVVKYEVLNEYLIPKPVEAVFKTYTQGQVSPTTTSSDYVLTTQTSSRPLYEFRGREVLRISDIFLILGITLVISSLILKYFMRVRS